MPSGPNSRLDRTPLPFDERLPLVLSVTGHRDPVEAQVDSLRASIESLLRELDALAPHTPIVVLSPLAEGADRIFAQACLDFRGRRRAWSVQDDPRGGLSLVAVLPMEQSEYEQDFVTPESLQQFRALLEQSEFHVPIPMPDGGSVDQLAAEREGDPEWKQRPLRDAQYARLGHFIAMQSNLVVAMWDGVDPRLEGGTAAIVGFCARGRLERNTVPLRSAIKDLEPNDPTPVAWIPMQRRKHASETALAAIAPDLASQVQRCWDAIPHREHLPQDPPPSWSRLIADLRWLDRLNHRIAAAGDGYPPDGPPTPIDARFRTLDAAASAAKQRLLRTMRSLLIAVVLTILALQATTAWSWWVWPMAYLLGLVSVWLGYRFIKKRGLEREAADLRLLAEALRVQRHWLQAGIVEQASDHYLAHRSLEIPVLRRFMRGATIEAFHPIDLNTPNAAPSPSAAIEPWLVGQRDWIKRTIGKIDRRQRRGRWALRSTMVLVVLLAATSLWLSLERAVPAGLFAWVDFLCGATLTISLGVGFWQKLRGDEEDLRRYRSMVVIFRDAVDRAQHADRTVDALLRAEGQKALDDPSAREARHRETLVKILRAVGKEALDEQAAWHALHRETLDELPVG